jgi:hypothetical protein
VRRGAIGDGLDQSRPTTAARALGSPRGDRVQRQEIIAVDRIPGMP